MDGYSGFPSDDVTGGASENASSNAVAAAIGTDERRMHVRAYNYWASLLDGREFPSIEDIDPRGVEDFGPHSVIVDLTGALNDPATPFVGQAIKDEIGVQTINSISDVPGRSLLSRLTDHHFQIIATRAPVGFEADFINMRGHDISYRGILMPFSSDGDAIDFVYGVINWKDKGKTSEPQVLRPRLPRLEAEREDEQEVLDRLYAEEEDQAERHERRKKTMALTRSPDEEIAPESSAQANADDWAIEALAELGISVDDVPEPAIAQEEADPTSDEAAPVDPAPAVAPTARPARAYGSLLGKAAVSDFVQGDDSGYGADLEETAEAEEDDILDLEEDVALPPTFDPANYHDDVIEAEEEEESQASFGSLAGALGPVRAKDEPTTTKEPRAAPSFAQPALRKYDFDPADYAHQEPEPPIDVAEPAEAVEEPNTADEATPVDAPLELDQDYGDAQIDEVVATQIDVPDTVIDDDAGLADRLFAARESAEVAKAGEGRTRAALYQALSLAYDFALAARAEPEDFAELLADSGVTAQARAPMTPIVKLVFGIDYDKARLTEFAAALSYADRQSVPQGGFDSFIGKSQGLKALVAAERQARRPDKVVADKGEEARAALRARPALGVADLAGEEEFMVVVLRRTAEGEVQLVALLDDDGLTERVIRKVA